MRRSLQRASRCSLASAEVLDQPVKETIHIAESLNDRFSFCQQAVDDNCEAPPHPSGMAKNDKESTVSANLLVRWFDLAGISQADFARKIGESDQTVNNWKRRGIPKGKLFTVSSAMGISAEQYLSDPDGKRRNLPSLVGVPQIVTYRTDDASLPPTYSIPRLDIGGSMGLGGRVQPELETIVGTIDINQQWVRSHLPQISSPNNLRVITGYGDSMEGTYNDGDILFVDTGFNDIRLDAVYVFSLGEELFIKRVQRRPDGSLAILSDNKKYEPYAIQNASKTDLRVIGRVVWAWNGRKL